MQTDVVIIGGGLAGLALADALERAGTDYLLLEARDRLGGRILIEETELGAYDMGPAWFWPGQPRIDAMIRRFELTRFDQYAKGILSFEDERGHVQRGRGYASMQGSWRLDGGLARLIDTLADSLEPGRVHLNARVAKLQRDGDGVAVTEIHGRRIVAQHVALALPPRLAAGSIQFSPALPEEAKRAMTSTPTWMAGQAKALAVYDRPFWREQGLSGDAMSRFGPMVEIHDASPLSGTEGALFGFIGVPSSGREDETALRLHITAQLGRLFGPEAGSPKALFVKDWAFDDATATAEDVAPIMAHPDYGMPTALRNLWGGRLLFSGTEVARQFGGYLEGALEAAEEAAEQLAAHKTEGASTVALSGETR